MGARRAIIHFCDNGLCTASRSHGAVDRGAETYKSVSIGRRHLHQYDIERERSCFEERFDLA